MDKLRRKKVFFNDFGLAQSAFRLYLNEKFVFSGEMMEELQIELASRSYPIVFGKLADNAKRLAGLLDNRKVLVVTDENVAAAGHLERLMALFPKCASIIISAGEANKTLDTVAMLCSVAAESGLDRHGVFLALGGGVVGDLTGFAAAIYMRGVDFVQIPTTLLAAVDSSVGGKTGADLACGKNLVGAFHQPRMVLVDAAHLATLPAHEWRNGLAETLKYGVIMDEAFFAHLEKNTAQLNAFDLDFYPAIIRHACELKARVVAEDERESGLRAILNYGHTTGHAVEQCSNFSVPHGEAVAMGMAAAAHLAVRMGLLAPEAQMRQDALLAALGLPTAIPANLDAEKLVAVMHKDKKASGGAINFILPTRIGAVVTRRIEDETLLKKALMEVQK